MKPEEKAEIILWDWLREYGDVYFNRKNLLGWKTFRVEGERKHIPDLLLITNLFGKTEAIIIEVKDGDTGANIRDGNKIFKKYFYISGKTKYFVGEKEIKIDRFIVATQYSPQGHLFGYGDVVQKNGAVGEPWLNKVVPRLEFVRTKDFGRSIIHDYSEYRKKEKYKDGPAIGWLISSVVLDFDLDELETQKGMKGNPVIQGVGWNSKLNKWGEFLVQLWKN